MYSSLLSNYIKPGGVNYVWMDSCRGCVFAVEPVNVRERRRILLYVRNSLQITAMLQC